MHEPDNKLHGMTRTVERMLYSVNDEADPSSATRDFRHEEVSLMW